ncbi:MAG: FtsX-like permease family protein [Bacilli bacterium]
MKAYFHSLVKTFTNHFSRFLSLVLIIFVGICFVTGAGGISAKTLNSFNDFYDEQNVTDLIIKDKSSTGFTADQEQDIKDLSFVKDCNLTTSIDLKINDEESRTYVYDFTSEINKLTLLEGTYPTSTSEVVVERSSSTIKSRKIGETITYSGMDFTITGIVQNPLMLSKDGDTSQTDEDESLSLVMYLDEEKNVLPLPKTDINILLKNEEGYTRFSSKYNDYVEECKQTIIKKEGFDEEKVAYLSLEQNKTYEIVKNLAEKVDVIVAMFPVFFILVVALVVLTTMTRLVDEERSQIGCLCSLGYSHFSIVFKYLLFALLSCLIGIGAGLGLGIFLIPNLCYPAFGNVFFLPTITTKLSYFMGVVSSIAMFISVVLVTLFVTHKSLKETPSALLLPKAPAPGRKILLERIGFIWKHLSFKYKSSIRNIFRYRGRLWMVILSVLGSTALVMAGLGLFDASDSIVSINGISVDLTSTLKPIALMIVGFAMALSVLVLFNLTDMNISERVREIATLEVLGYGDREVYGYIFREVFISASFGVALGIPAGVGLLAFVFIYLKFGSLSDINWYSYLLTIGLSFIFIVIVDLLLMKKIKSIDMKESLKSIE